MSADSNPKYDYIVVGAGAGGGTLAARLAEADKRVLLLDAGGDPVHMKGGDAVDPDGNRLPLDYHVPVFHAIASENHAAKWDFFTEHYSDPDRQKADPKWNADWSQMTGPPGDPEMGPGGDPSKSVGPGKSGSEARGVLYPRYAGLGGCTSHNAMITVYPHNDDWEFIKLLTGDPSWSADNMRRYFQRLENCHHRPIQRFLAKLGINPSRHGYDGWLRTELALPWRALKKDIGLIRALTSQAKVAIRDERGLWDRLRWFLVGRGDPNDWRLVRQNSVGIRYPPLATNGHRRTSARERILEVAKKYPLEYRLHALATKVLFDGTRAIGVEFLEGERLYRAFWNPSNEDGDVQREYCSGEVILSGGAFNSPQLLMLSGIGPADELERHGIDRLKELPGVGRNLQDRYEVGLVYRMKKNWEVLRDAKFNDQDPQYKEWEKGEGVYTSNGAVLAVIKRSLAERPLPDLFIFALLGLFRGYFPSYSAYFPKNLNTLTWAVLKAHTVNNSGYVKLRSSDPRDTPEINFKYFEEGNDKHNEDVRSVVEGMNFVRKMTRPLVEKGELEELAPGVSVNGYKELAKFAQDRAWGHHASCTCKIGSESDNGVVDGDFRVHGVDNLRVVDASVFPKIPGFFIVSSVYTIAEKAADVILADAEVER